MAMAHGMPAIQETLDHGLRPSLSSDHTATSAQDMFGMMRTTFNKNLLLGSAAGLLGWRERRQPIFPSRPCPSST
jgi:5-methylthioadenosine/S-adenosylhomocysteine deaminase